MSSSIQHRVENVIEGPVELTASENKIRRCTSVIHVLTGITATPAGVTTVVRGRPASLGSAVADGGSVPMRGPSTARMGSNLAWPIRSGVLSALAQADAAPRVGEARGPT